MKVNEERDGKLSECKDCNSNLKRGRWLTLSVNVDKTFLPVKLTYFLYISAWTVFKPYFPIFTHELGMNAAQIGILRAIEPVTNFVASPVWGTISDKFHIHKMLMLACVIGSSICIPLFVFVPTVTNLDEDRHSLEEYLPLMPSNVEVSASRENSSFTTASSQTSQEYDPSKLFPRDSILSFTLCAFITTADNIFNAGFMPLFDSNTMELCRYYPRNTFGGQRAMGALAVAVISPFVGYLFDVYKYITDTFNFSFLGNRWAPFFFMYSIVMLLTLFPVSKLKVVPIQPPESFSKEVLQIFRDRQVLITFLVVVVCGISKGIAAAFLFLFLEELHTSKLLMSLTLVMTCAPETICLLFSRRIIKALNYEGVFCLGLFAYAIRFLGYSMIPEKATWVVLPIESLHGICYGLIWPDCTEYANYIAPDGMSATLQSIMNSVHSGVGEIIGIVGGGFIYNSFGARRLFHLSAAVCSLTFVIYAINLVVSMYCTGSPENKEEDKIYEPLMKQNDLKGTRK